MIKPVIKFNVQDTLKVLNFYRLIVVKDLMYSLIIVLSGLASRGLSICIFMVIVKVFLGLFSPEASLDLINQALLFVSSFQMTEQQMLSSMIGLLLLLVVLQNLFSRVNLFVFTQRRRHHIKSLIKKGLNDDMKTNYHLCLDHFPHGYDATLKCCEISLFFLLLLIIILVISPLAGLLVFLIIPLLIGVLVIKNKAEIYTVKELRECREGFNIGSEAFDEYAVLLNKQYSFGRKNIMLSDSLGGLVIVLIMLFFIFGETQTQLHNLSALALVFAIRFAVIYAGELSRHANRLLQQRVVINKVTNTAYL